MNILLIDGRESPWLTTGLHFFAADVINVLLQSLDARAKYMSGSKANLSSHGSASVLKKDKEHGHSAANIGNRQAQGLSAIYMLNNVSFVRREILLNSNVPDVLAGGEAPHRRDSGSTGGGFAVGSGGGEGGGNDAGIEDELNRRNRSAKTGYLEIFSPLVACLMDAGVEHSVLKSAIGVGHTEKKDIKDRFARFNDALEEIEGLHRIAKLDKNEEGLRERSKDEVIRMCLPTYAAFVKRHDNFSKSGSRLLWRVDISLAADELDCSCLIDPSKYLKIDASGLQAKLEALFA